MPEPDQSTPGTEVTTHAAVAGVTTVPAPLDVVALLAAHDTDIASLREAVATLSHAVLRLENEVTALMAERERRRDG